MDTVAYSVRSSDGVVGTSGTPKNIYGFHVLAGGSNSTIAVYDGTGTTGVKVMSIVALASKTTTIDFVDMGVRFLSGCYLDVDANTVSITTFYKEVL